MKEKINVFDYSEQIMKALSRGTVRMIRTVHNNGQMICRICQESSLVEKGKKTSAERCSCDVLSPVSFLRTVLPFVRQTDICHFLFLT
jgi:hypothetical protein